ncbi:MAG: Smr/MutS family protein [Candidatus Marinimicrobia bacterium]|nr:Smr/MutS family protein [Candidatus Neomarinimicrobiota bacterium]
MAQILVTEQFKSDVGFPLICDWLKDHCSSEENKNYFSTLTPITDISQLNESFDFTDELTAAIQRETPLPMSTIPSVSDWVSVLEIVGSQLNQNQFRELYKILTLSKNIKSYINKENFPKWVAVGKDLYASGKSIATIQKVFDDDFTIKPDASPTLKELHRSLQKTQGGIKQTMQKIFIEARENDWLGGDQIAWRHGRSVLPLKANRKSKIKGIVQDQSATGQTVYVEPIAIIELNNRITELHFSIREEENRILRELTTFFHPFVQEITTTVHILNILDRHNTIARLADKLDAVRPEFNDKGILKIDTAVNPLFTLVDKPAIPLTLEMEDEKILLLSGPNAGGKTVVLKSVGLYCLMAQCRLYTPAKIAQLPLFTAFMADIGDRQSIDDDLSTFSAHIQALTDITDRANTTTLILLDELGTGTDPEAGAAISRAILEKIKGKGASVLATTHLGALKVWAAEEKGIINGNMSFDSDKLMPSYTLQLGMPGASYALEISKRMGLSDEIISRSKSLLGDGSVHLENLLAKLDREQTAIKQLKMDLEDREAKLQHLEKEMQQKEKEIAAIHKSAKTDANLKSEELLIQSRREIEKLVAEIRKNQADSRSIKKAKEVVQTELTRIQSDQNEEVTHHSTLSMKDAKPGVMVFIPKLNTDGKITALPDKKNRVRVEANGIRITLKLEELSRLDPPQKEQQKKVAPSLNKVSAPASLQLDLRGKRVEEAIGETTAFLDGALLSGLSFVHILHGKGTGALMSAIREFLSSQSFISRYYFADEDQGGAGITVVEFK